MNFDIVLTPEKDTLWFGGKYKFSIKIPDDYNNEPPEVRCLTKVYHPNIDIDGAVCLNILKKDWSPIWNMSAVLAGIYFLFTDPNPNDPLNHKAAEVLRDNYDQFKQNVLNSLKGKTIDGEKYDKFI